MLVYVPVSLGGASAGPAASESETPLRAWLTAILAAHAPAKLATVDAALAKYAGREAQLVAFVRRKYGATSGPAGLEGSPPPSPLRAERYRAPGTPSVGWQQSAHPPPGFASRVFGPRSPHVALQHGVSGLPGASEGEGEFVCASVAERWRRGDPSRGLVTQTRYPAATAHCARFLTTIPAQAPTAAERLPQGRHDYSGAPRSAACACRRARGWEPLTVRRHCRGTRPHRRPPDPPAARRGGRASARARRCSDFPSTRGAHSAVALLLLSKPGT